MMPYYRAMATANYMRRELQRERDAHAAMKLCFKKIHKSLDLYKGHFIDRIRFHMNRHHAVYMRKVRSIERMNRRTMKEQQTTPHPRSRASLRVGIASEMAVEIQQLQSKIAEQNTEIERLCTLVGDLDSNTI